MCVFDDDPQSGLLASAAASLGYEIVDGMEGLPPEDCVAALVDTHLDPTLELTRALAARMRVILVAEDESFEFRLAAARAGVEAVLRHPLDIVELGAWLEDFDAAGGREPSILIVDDDELAGQSYAVVLEEAGMRTHVIADPTAALEAISAFSPDLVLLDLHMPVADGLEVATIIRQCRRDLSLPIVFLSGERDAERQDVARKIGGDDFITKPVDLTRLAPQVRMRAERAMLLRQVMERDSLTGLLNHARFKDRVATELERAARTGSPVSVCLVDIDHFKAVNDTHGHQVGDRVLRTLAHSLVGGLRKIDVVARYGGEEFGIILPVTPLRAAGAVLNRLRRRFGEIAFDGSGGRFLSTFSAGIAEGDRDSRMEELLRRADEALYEAKKAGRNQVVAM